MIGDILDLSTPISYKGYGRNGIYATNVLVRNRVSGLQVSKSLSELSFLLDNNFIYEEYIQIEENDQLSFNKLKEYIRLYKNYHNWEYIKDLDYASTKEEIINAPDNAGLELLLWVCEYIKNDRFPEAELEIIKHPYFAVRYAKEIIKDRWPEAESIILTDNYATYQYIINVIKDRWLEAEKTFNTYWWSVYKETFLK